MSEFLFEMYEHACFEKPRPTASIEEKIDQAKKIVETVIAQHSKTHEIVKVMPLYSGGNDSAVVAHLFKSCKTIGHCNTQIGIPDTRVHVYQTVADFGCKLIEKKTIGN